MNTFEKNIIQLHQEKGRQWLAGLHKTIDYLADQWTLSDVQPIKNMSWHYVAFAKQNEKTPVVIKIGCDKAVSLDECRCLKYFDSHGAIELLDYDEKNSALLLARAIPGESLKSMRDDVTQKLTIYADTVKSLLRYQAAKDEFSHVSRWCNAIDRITDPRINQSYVDISQKLRSYLLSSAKEEYVCHGDLHCENVLHHQAEWIVIDPKGIVGEVAFEAAAFDFLSDTELKREDKVAELVLSRTRRLAEILNIDQARLVFWVFLRAIISAQWFIEDGGDPSERLKIIKHLYPLVNQFMGQ